MYARDIMCTHPRSSLFGTVPVFGSTRPIHDRSRSSRRFRTIGVCVYVCCDPSLLYLSFGSGSSCIRPRVLFAYFVLRTRRIRSSHFRHVCLCSSARDRIDGDVDATRFRCRTVSLWRSTKKSGKKALLSAASCTCASLSTIPRLHEKLGVCVHRS